MKYTLYSLNDWLEGEEDLELLRREYYRALYGDHPDDDRPRLELDVPDRRRRMTATDMIQNLALIIVVLFLLIAVFAWRAK